MSPERSPVFTRSGDLPGVATSARAEGTRWTAAVLPSLGAEESLPPTLARYVAGRGQPVSSVYRELPDTWEAFERDLNKSMRDNVRYYPRLMVRSGHAFVFEIAATPDEV